MLLRFTKCASSTLATNEKGHGVKMKLPNPTKITSDAKLKKKEGLSSTII